MSLCFTAIIDLVSDLASNQELIHSFACFCEVFSAGSLERL